MIMDCNCSNKSYIKRKLSGVYRYPHNGLVIYYEVWKKEVRSNLPWMMTEVLFDEKTGVKGPYQATAIPVTQEHWDIFYGNRVG